MKASILKIGSNKSLLAKLSPPSRQAHDLAFFGISMIEYDAPVGRVVTRVE